MEFSVPTVSVIVPVYKAEKYLSKCIDSILSQTYKEFELILIDDGSPDGCGKICDNYAKRDSRIKVIHKENGGVSSARNAGIKESIGKYICFVDSDDMLIPEFLDECLKSFEDLGVNLAVCGYSIRDVKGQVNNITYSNKSAEVLNRNGSIMNLLEKVLIAAPWGKLYRADIIKDNDIVFPIELSCGEDLIFNFRYCDFAKEIAMINKPLYFYNTENEASLMNVYRADLLSLKKTIIKELSFFIKKWNVESEQKKKFENYVYYSYESVLFNTFSENNKDSFLNKLKYNRDILKSDEFSKVLREFNGNLNFVYRLGYLLHSYLLIYLFDKFASVVRGG